MPDVDLPATLTCLKETATTQMKQYPQYKGHFTNYQLVRVKCEVHTPKAGLAFKRGEYAIAVQQDLEPSRVRSEKFVTVWSRRNQVDTSVRNSDVEWL